MDASELAQLVATENERGLTLEVHARPGAKRAALCGLHDGALKIAVTGIAENGKANAALRVFLAELFGIPRSGVTLLRGARRRRKAFLLEGLDLASLEARLGDGA